MTGAGMTMMSTAQHLGWFGLTGVGMTMMPTAHSSLPNCTDTARWLITCALCTLWSWGVAMFSCQRYSYWPLRSVFRKNPGNDKRSRTEGLKQENIHSTDKPWPRTPTLKPPFPFPSSTFSTFSAHEMDLMRGVYQLYFGFSFTQVRWKNIDYTHREVVKKRP